MIFPKFPTHRLLQSLALALVIVPFTPPVLAETTKGGAVAGWAEFTSFDYEGSDPVFDQTPPKPGAFHNPILTGFYPDPSICRAGKDFYLINSTFSYYPGVPIFHSTDLVNWNQIGHILDRPSQLDVDGLPVSCGIFAPAIQYHDGLFYMITTNVYGIGNFYVTAKNPAGPWSEPVKLPLDGIDPSFFFDDDGRAYIVHNGNPPDKKPLYDGHRAIWLWEFDAKTQSVKNGRIVVNGGVDISKKPAWIEGPHLFKRNGWYYLCAAEGGTGPNHSQVILRTKSLAEPFVPFPGNPILTQRDMDPNRPDPVTCLGHADLVETPNGEWWAVFLGVRPYGGGYSNLGRETYLLPVTWENDWPMILKPGVPLPRNVKRPNLPPSAPAKTPLNGSFSVHDDFNGKELGQQWFFLRTPREPWWSLTAKPGSLMIAPRPVALHSIDKPDPAANGNPSFVARRLQHVRYSASTTLVLNPAATAGDAGLAALQNDTNYFFLGVHTEPGKPRSVFLEQRTKNTSAETLASETLPENAKAITFRMEGDGKDQTFSYRVTKDGEWKVLKAGVDGSILSTGSAGGFVGATLGMYARSTR
ncbi:glycoside hydrolase family 43 protein [Luteolibacter sp. LG18]|uniref:glycoside hydrolase family 43 protein n=1 Tax=Luteolibacter sp. LG18 TaxID=2819286 RepID=UPI002B2C2383|nr:xylosidase/arabinosidase [Luteolibacter sp. LG18]